MRLKPLRLLLVDDDALEGRLLKANIDRPGRVEVELARSGAEALQTLARLPCDGVVTDLLMPGMDGIELVRRIRATDPFLPTFIMTAHASLSRAVEGIRAGATDFLPKPVNVDALMTLAERATNERPEREEVASRMVQRRTTPIEERLVGAHPRLDDVRRFAHHLAQIPGARVLITGESGTGKSALARVIHDLSGVPGRLVEVNCAAIPANLLESELFGHEKGAFTDARALKRGLIEAADNGTLLLDEIGALPFDLQAKLLLFVESREIRRVGGTQPIPVTTRVIAATNEDLRRRAWEKTFRLDLLYRLDVASVEMPPLRAIAEVIPELGARFARLLAAEFKRPEPELALASFEALDRYPWPGNARELRNAVERALIFHGAGPLVVTPPADGQVRLPEVGVAMEHGLTLEEVEHRYLAATLEANRHRHLEELARTLGISRKTLWEKRRRYRL